jgi:hypothetical protein
MATTTNTFTRELSNQNSQGTRLGTTSTDIIGFYGATPVARLTGATSNISSVSSSYAGFSTQTASTAGEGFSTAAMFASTVAAIDHLKADVIAISNNLNAMHAAMSTMGFYAGS